MVNRILTKLIQSGLSFAVLIGLTVSIFHHSLNETDLNHESSCAVCAISPALSRCGLPDNGLKLPEIIPIFSECHPPEYCRIVHSSTDTVVFFGRGPPILS